MSRLRRITATPLAIALAGAALAGCLDDESPTAPGTAAPAAVIVGPVLTVTNTGGSGSGSLAEALVIATDGTTIAFDPGLAGQTIKLAGHLTLPAGLTLTVEGPAAGGITLDAQSNDVVLVVDAGATATLRNITITGGAGGYGGGISNHGDLTLENCTVTGNESTGLLAHFLGGVGGGIATDGPLTLINTTVSGNQTDNWGGGIFSDDYRATFTLINSTIAYNSAGVDGGGVMVLGTDNFDLRNSIIANNSSGGRANCYVDVSITLGQYTGVQLTNNASDCVLPDNAQPTVIYADPIDLGPLADNGGPTFTHALPRGNPAIDAGTQCGPTTDQRYVARPQGLGCDIGAFEFDDYTEFTNTIDPNVVLSPNTGEPVITGSLTCSHPALVDLTVTLTQDQKHGRLSSQVSSSDHTLVDCNGTRSWSIVLPPSPAAFKNGSGTVMATSPVDYPNYLLGSSAQEDVKIFWGHK